MINYADDTTLLVRANNFSQLIREASFVLNVIQNWLLENNLILNKEKTNFIIFKTSRSTKNFPLNTLINNDNVQFISATKFLGIITDTNLSWTQHISELVKKINSVTYSMRVVKKYVTYKTLRMIYYACFVSRLRFGIIFWGGAAAAEINKLLIVQKQALRCMHDIPLRESCRGSFRKNRLLTVAAIYIFECLMFNFKYKNKYELHEITHSYNTRHNNYNFPIHRLSMIENGPCYASMRFFNILPNRIKNIQNVKKYKRELFNLLLEVEPYNVKEFIEYKRARL